MFPRGLNGPLAVIRTKNQPLNDFVVVRKTDVSTHCGDTTRVPGGIVSRNKSSCTMLYTSMMCSMDPISQSHFLVHV